MKVQTFWTGFWQVVGSIAVACFWTDMHTVWIILKQGLDCFEVFVAADLWTTLVQVMEQFDAS